MGIVEIYNKSQIHRVLSSDIDSNMLSHCYLISCSDEYMLNEYAFFMAKEIYCLADNKPCNICNNCNKVSHSNMVDLCVFPTENKNLMVEDINTIVSDCYIRPIENDYKVYILKNFDLCTVQAQNKILKTLEEPPANVVFILTCTNINMVLPTISSRAKKISESLLDKETVIGFLQENNIKNADIIVSMSGGDIGIAMKLTENEQATEIVDLAFSLLSGLRTSSDILRFSSQIINLKKDIRFFLDSLIMVLRDITVCNSDAILNFENNRKKIMELSNIYTAEMISLIVEKITLVFNKIEFNCNITGVVDKLLLDILEVKFLCQK